MLEYLAVNDRVLLRELSPASLTTTDQIRMNARHPAYPFGLINTQLCHFQSHRRPAIFKVDPQGLRSPAGSEIQTLTFEYQNQTVTFNREPSQPYHHLSPDLQDLVYEYNSGLTKKWVHSVDDDNNVVWSLTPQPPLAASQRVPGNSLVQGLISATTTSGYCAGISKDGRLWWRDWLSHPYPVVDLCFFKAHNLAFLNITGSVHAVRLGSNVKNTVRWQLSTPQQIVQLLDLTETGEQMRCLCLDGSVVEVKLKLE